MKHDFGQFALLQWAAMNVGFWFSLLFMEFTSPTIAVMIGLASLIIRAITATIYERQQEQTSGT